MISRLPAEHVNARRGRPGRNEIDVLQVRLWMSSVGQDTGLTPGQLEKRFEPEKCRQRDGKEIRPGAWSKYAQGTRSPTGALGLDLVRRVDISAPGTAGWFLSPLWKVMKHRHLSPSQTDRLLLSATPTVWSFLYRGEQSTGQFIREPITRTRLKVLSGLRTIDAFAGLLALTIEESPQEGQLFHTDLQKACRWWLRNASSDMAPIRRHWEEILATLRMHVPAVGDLDLIHEDDPNFFDLSDKLDYEFLIAELQLKMGEVSPREAMFHNIFGPRTSNNSGSSSE